MLLEWMSGGGAYGELCVKYNGRLAGTVRGADRAEVLLVMSE